MRDDAVERIAVIIPAYNVGRYLAACLDSLLAQTLPDWMAVCIDDGSTDATPRILAEYAARDGRFKVLAKPNGGVSSARNAGLDALADWPQVSHVVFLDADDFLHPQCLEVASAAARTCPGAIVGWDFAKRDPDGFLARRHSPRDVRLMDGCRGTEVWGRMFPADTIAGIRFCEEVSIAEDAAYLLEVQHRHHPTFRSLPCELGFYRQHGESNMHRSLTEADFVERRAVVRRMLGTLADAPAEQRDFCRSHLPGLLKRFYRDLGRVAPAEAEGARRVFAGLLAELRAAGRLKPQRGTPKDLKYYFRFLWMSRRVR